ncbi:reverse transcriptase domain-containing protein [Tanacetum coccineum]
MAPKKRTTRASPATKTTTTSVTNAQLKALIDKGVADALAARDADKSMNGDDSYNSRTGVRRNEMFPKESDKIERYVGGLPDMIHGSMVASKPKTLQKQQPPKKQGVAIAYTACLVKGRSWLELYHCSKVASSLHGQFTLLKCAMYKKVGHLTRDCRSPAATNNQRNPTCYECRNQGHYRSDCPELKNQNHGNQAEGTGPSEVVHALRGGETNQDLNNMEDDINV